MKSLRNELEWVKRNSPLTTAALRSLPPDSDLTLSLHFHIDIKMVPVIESLSQKFALQVFPCHPDTTDPRAWSYLGESCEIRLASQWSPEQAQAFLSREKAYLCDLGGDMICWALEQNWPIKAALEGTTSGLRRIGRVLEQQPATFPIWNWNETALKREIHNEKMVGFSVWQTFTETTRLSLHGKSVGVFGFGPVGRGIARTARVLGGCVSVFDPSPNSSMVAAFEGFHCPAREQVLSSSDILVTATGVENALKFEDLAHLKTGSMILNAGHSETEIAIEIREHPQRSQLLEHIEEIALKAGRSVYLLARGRLLNLSAGAGDTINGFDVTSAVLVRALNAVLSDANPASPGLHVFEG